MVPEIPILKGNIVNHISEGRGFSAMTVLLAVICQCHVAVVDLPWYKMLRICRNALGTQAHRTRPPRCPSPCAATGVSPQRSSSAKQVPRWGLEFADTGSKEG